jgi:hypothetical protein
MTVSLPVSTPLDITVSRIRRALPRLRRPTALEPWGYERLATPREIRKLRKTDMRRAA